MDAYADMLADAADPDDVFSFCSRRIMTGKFECGTTPTAALYERAVLYRNATEAPDNPAPVPELAALAVLLMHDGRTGCCPHPLPKASFLCQPMAVHSSTSFASHSFASHS